MNKYALWIIAFFLFMEYQDNNFNINVKENSVNIGSNIQNKNQENVNSEEKNEINYFHQQLGECMMKQYDLKLKLNWDSMDDHMKYAFIICRQDYDPCIKNCVKDQMEFSFSEDDAKEACTQTCDERYTE